MPIMTRLARLMRADLHALLDRLESPDLVLAQAVRDMEQALDQERRTLALRSREAARLDAQSAELGRTLQENAEALDDCLAADQDSLARPVIRRRLETERHLAAISRRRVGLDGECRALEKAIADKTRRLDELRARAALFEEESTADQGCVMEVWNQGDATVRDADVEVALLRAKRLRGMAP